MKHTCKNKASTHGTYLWAQWLVTQASACSSSSSFFAWDSYADGSGMTAMRTHGIFMYSQIYTATAAGSGGILLVIFHQHPTVISKHHRFQIFGFSQSTKRPSSDDAIWCVHSTWIEWMPRCHWTKWWRSLRSLATRRFGQSHRGQQNSWAQGLVGWSETKPENGKWQNMRQKANGTWKMTSQKKNKQMNNISATMPGHDEFEASKKPEVFRIWTFHVPYMHYSYATMWSFLSSIDNVMKFSMWQAKTSVFVASQFWKLEVIEGNKTRLFIRFFAYLTKHWKCLGGTEGPETHALLTCCISHQTAR